MAVFNLCLLTLLVAYIEGSYVFSNSIVAAGGDYNVSYNFNASADTLEFWVEVRATGWVGFGFALTAPNNMTNYDVAVGGVLSNGSGYLADYYTNGFAMPPRDDQQDWNLVDSSEQNNVTTLKFYRQRNTSDANDVAIEQGMPIFLILAYHESNDVDPSSGNFTQHTNRSFQSVTLIPSASSTVPTVSANSSSPATVMAPMATSTLESTSTSTLATATTSTMPVMTTLTLELTSTSTLATTTTSTMPVMTTLTLESTSTSTLATATTSTMPTMTALTLESASTSTLSTATTSTMPAMTTSALEAINTFTTSSIAPTATTANPTPVASSSVVPTMQTPNFVSFGNDSNYNVSWTSGNSSTDTLHFVVTVRTTGWIAFGVTNQAPNTMVGYDVAVGGVLSGSGYLRDYFTNGQSQPPEDTQQDWILSYSREENGVTTLKFYRRLSTSDANDVIIQQGMPIFLVWAYHSTSDVQSGSFGGRHTSRGWLGNVVLVPGAAPTTGVKSALPTTVAVMPPGFTRGFDNNRYVLSWRFDDQADMMYYHLRVKTTGWVGFGFAEKAPNTMIDYDVVVAGFSNGRGYLFDYKTTGRRLPSLDDSQDYTLKNASEAGGYTELWFERPRDTGDGNDITFQPGVGVHFIWAYSTADITDERNFGRHSTQGWSSDQVVQVAAQQPVPTQPSGASTPCSIIYLIVTLFTAILTAF